MKCNTAKSTPHPSLRAGPATSAELALSRKGRGYFSRIIKQWRLRIAFANCLRALAQLQQAYFSCYIKRNYLSKQSDYEKILYKKRSLLLGRMGRARCLLQKNEEISKKGMAIFSKIEHLNEIIFSLNQLRFRVSGYAIFEICIAEMQALEKASMTALKSLTQIILRNKRATYSIELLDRIHAFEAISHRTLQIASPEPIVFLFFIQDLYAFYDEINEWP